MCMCFLMELKEILTKLRPFKLIHFRQLFSHCRVWHLCNQLLLVVSMDVSQTLQTYCGYTEDVHVGF